VSTHARTSAPQYIRITPDSGQILRRDESEIFGNSTPQRRRSTYFALVSVNYGMAPVTGSTLAGLSTGLILTPGVR
jgi:hypothetical protein